MLQDCKLNKSTIYSMKTGKSPSIDTLSTIALYLNVSADYLLGNTDDSIPPRAKKEEPTYEVGSFDWFRQFLTKRGIIEEGGDLTDEQLKFALTNLENLVRFFKNGNQE